MYIFILKRANSFWSTTFKNYKTLWKKNNYFSKLLLLDCKYYIQLLINNSYIVLKL